MSFAAKLLVALAVTVIVAVGAVALVINRAVGQRFDEYVVGQSRPRVEALAAALESGYAADGDWRAAEALLRAYAAGGGPGYGRGEMHNAAMGLGVALLDAQGCPVYATRQYADMPCLTARQLRAARALTVGGNTVGYLLTGVGPAEEAFRVNTSAALAWAGGVATLVALLLGVLLIRTLSKPLRDVRAGAQRLAAGDLAYRVPVTAHDEIGEVAQQFNEMASALERDEQLRQRLMADIAHELRTPLTVIRAQTEALTDGVFALTAENLEPIRDQTAVLSRLVEDLRDLALAEAGRLPLEMGDVDLGALAQRACDAFRSQARSLEIALTCDIPADGPVVRADAQRLSQVLGNLLSNALRHTPAGGTVTVRAWGDARGAHVSVRDTGEGIAPEDLPHLFERFYRTDPARTRADGGTGLGLAIARHWVEAHGGTLAVESQVGAGATFTITLP